jgi:hypothetical protein
MQWDVLTAVNMIFFWYMTPCKSMEIFRQVVCETLIIFYQSARRQFAEDKAMNYKTEIIWSAPF